MKIKKRIKLFLLYWPNAWCDLFDSTIWILTLGQWKPDLGIKYILFTSKMNLTKRLNLKY